MEQFVGIREIEDEKVFYVRKTGPYELIAKPAFMELLEFIEKNKLEIPSTNPKVKVTGISYDDPLPTSLKDCRFDACITATKNVPAEGNVNIQTLNGGKYAVFLHKGPYEKLGALYQAIYGEWLPDNNYKIRDLTMREIYLNNPQVTYPQDLLTEICLPIE